MGRVLLDPPHLIYGHVVRKYMRGNRPSAHLVNGVPGFTLSGQFNSCIFSIEKALQELTALHATAGRFAKA